MTSHQIFAAFVGLALTILSAGTAFAKPPSEAPQAAPDDESPSDDNVTAWTPPSERASSDPDPAPARRQLGDVTVFGELIGGFTRTLPVGGPNLGARLHLGRNFAVSLRATFDFWYATAPNGPFNTEFRVGGTLGARVQAPIDRSTLYWWAQFGPSVGWGSGSPERLGRLFTGIGYEYLFDNGWSTGVELGAPAPVALSFNVGHNF